MRFFKLIVPLMALALAGSAWAGVYVDAQTDVRQRMRIATNEVTFAWDWNWVWVPPNATSATIVAKGHFHGWTNSAARPATSMTWKLFDLPAPRILDDVITATLTFTAEGGFTTSQSATYELRAGSFGQAEVRACETNNSMWAKFELPCTIPFDIQWFEGYRFWDGFTWLQFKDPAGVRAVIGPPWGHLGNAPAGFQTVPAGYLPRDVYWVELWRDSTMFARATIKSLEGSIFIIR